MLERTFSEAGTRSTALYSPCETYRYALAREWGPGKRVVFVMLNPSTADERRNDPTVERCERRARMAGAGAFKVVNLFAFRATLPACLKQAADPVGPQNDKVLAAAADWGEQVICGWGTHGSHLSRDLQTEAILRAKGVTLWHLGLTKAGQPRHPLYLPYARQPEPWVR